MPSACRAISAAAGKQPGGPSRTQIFRFEWSKFQNQSTYAKGAIKATNDIGTTITLCDLCDHYKLASAGFSMTQRVCNFYFYDYEEDIGECSSCVKHDLFGPSPEPASLLLLLELENVAQVPEIIDLVSQDLTPEPVPKTVSWCLGIDPFKAQQIVDNMSTDPESSLEPPVVPRKPRFPTLTTCTLSPAKCLRSEAIPYTTAYTFCGHQGHPKSDCPARVSQIEAIVNLYLTSANNPEPVESTALTKLAKAVELVLPTFLEPPTVAIPRVVRNPVIPFNPVLVTLLVAKAIPENPDPYLLDEPARILGRERQRWLRNYLIKQRYRQK